jgi:hypothetical protein
MPEGIADAITELVARLGDAFVGSPAMRARVAAILNEGDFGIWIAKHVVYGVIVRTVEVTGWDHGLHR